MSEQNFSNIFRSNDVELQVVTDIVDRQKRGLNKYGCSVANNPLTLREWLNHAYEECLDQSIYLKRAIMMLDENNA